MNFWKKIFCLHDYEYIHARLIKYSHSNYKKTRILYKCKKCDKFKTIDIEENWVDALNEKCL